jgi:hypothetical protein
VSDNYIITTLAGISQSERAVKDVIINTAPRHVSRLFSFIKLHESDNTKTHTRADRKFSTVAGLVCIVIVTVHVLACGTVCEHNIVIVIIIIIKVA